MRTYVLWALMDPEKSIAHIHHSTDSEVAKTFTVPIGWDWKEKRGAKNLGAYVWYQYLDRLEGQPFKPELVTWFDDMKARGVVPVVRTIEWGELTADGIKSRKADVMQILKAVGFDVLTAEPTLVERKGPLSLFRG